MKSINGENQIDGYKVALAVRKLEIIGISSEVIDRCKGDIESIMLQHGIFFKWNDAEKALLIVILKEFASRDEINKAIRQVQSKEQSAVCSPPVISDACQRIIEIQQRIHNTVLKPDSTPVCFVREQFRVL